MISNSERNLKFIMMGYATILVLGAVGNIWICYIAKGNAWDIYPFIQIIWVAMCIYLVTKCTSMRRLVLVIIGFQFFDSYVDQCALGNENTWWAGPPVLLEWQWNQLKAEQVFYKYFYNYWIFTWVIQIPLRSIMMARFVSGGWGKEFLIIALGLNVIWFTAPQDALYYFVWWGLYDINHHYFEILPPEGFWNLWNMLLVRIPLGVTLGALLIYAGRTPGQDWNVQTKLLVTVAGSILFVYASYFMLILTRTFA